MKDVTIKFYSFKEFQSFIYERVISLIEEGELP